jgi:hypothetical protein
MEVASYDTKLNVKRFGLHFIDEKKLSTGVGWGWLLYQALKADDINSHILPHVLCHWDREVFKCTK